jgi:AraC family transcriptional regulator of adaptative response/methylated-DNA-[protein]-cysteine methyltransferase
VNHSSETWKPEQRNGNQRRASDEIQFAIGDSSLGLVLVAGSATGLCAVFLGDDRRALRRELQCRFPDAALVEGDAAFGALAVRVIEFVESPGRGLDVALDLRGTEFQLRVWQALREIPAGSTASYGEIASRLNRPKSARDVGGACAANPLAVVVPCHRVVKKDGTLSGYRWGVDRKRALLEREAAA